MVPPAHNDFLFVFFLIFYSSSLTNDFFNKSFFFNNLKFNGEVRRNQLEWVRGSV